MSVRFALSGLLLFALLGLLAPGASADPTIQCSDSGPDVFGIGYQACLFASAVHQNIGDDLPPCVPEPDNPIGDVFYWIYCEIRRSII